MPGASISLLAPVLAAGRDARRGEATAHIDTLYILSAGHSGSTLLNLMLGSHPKACAVSELTYLSANIHLGERCTCGQPMRACEHWRAVFRCLEARLGYDVLSEPLRLDLGCRDAPNGPYKPTHTYRVTWKLRRMAVYAALLSPVQLTGAVSRRFEKCIDNRLAVYDSIRQASGAEVVIDSSKEYLTGLFVYQRLPARTRLILLTRDGRAVFNSGLRRGFSREYALRAWRNYYRNTVRVLGRTVDPAHVFTLRYEDLATDPAGALAEVCEFAGLEFHPDMLDWRSRRQHITSGNHMRFGASGAIRLDTKWCHELSAADRAFFEKRAGGLNRRLGYP